MIKCTVRLFILLNTTSNFSQVPEIRNCLSLMLKMPHFIVCSNSPRGERQAKKIVWHLTNYSKYLTMTLRIRKGSIKNPCLREKERPKMCFLAESGTDACLLQSLSQICSVHNENELEYKGKGSKFNSLS